MPAIAQKGVRAEPGRATAGVRDVLVVDDSRVQRRILAAQLARSGYQVAEASTVDDALAICRAAMPDIIISDWMMPGLSGLDLCREIRALGCEEYVYFILLTSKTEATEVALGLDAGADDFLTKPITGDELRARIAAGQRILHMQEELREKNRLLTRALAELQMLYDSLDRDLREAWKLQQSLVRERHRRFGPAEVTLLLQPCGHVGGDLVGFFPVNAGRIAVYALDVSGHGIASALMTARLAGLLSAATPELNVALEATGDGFDAIEPAEVARRLNRIVQDEMQTESYFTMVFASIELATGRVVLVQAGHPHPAILRADGSVDFVGQGGLPVGLVADADYETVSVDLRAGDRLLLLSDGITEAADAAGRMLGEEGLARMLSACAGARGPALPERLLAALADRSGGPFADDVSGAFVDYAGLPAGSAAFAASAAAAPAQRPVARQPVSR